MIIQSFLPVELPTQDRQPAFARPGLVFAFYSAMAAVAFVLSASLSRPNLFTAPGNCHWILSSGLGIALGGLVVLLSRQAHARTRWARRLNQEFRSTLGKLNTQEIWILALGSSFAEEMLFRGALLPWLGLWLQALLFACLHIGPGRQFLPWTLASFAMALAFGWITSSTGCLAGAIIAHFLINFLNLRFIASDQGLERPRLDMVEVVDSETS